MCGATAAGGRWRGWLSLFAGEQGQKTTKVFLAAAHLNHDPGDNRPRNLRAFCQRCHMLHDREEP